MRNMDRECTAYRAAMVVPEQDNNTRISNIYIAGSAGEYAGDRIKRKPTWA
jgi:hypothetical protein